MPDYSFTKKERLLKPGDFVRVLKYGRKTQTESFRLAVLSNSLGNNRLGISVSAKVAGSVRRSRIKRLIREFFRINKGEIKVGSFREGSKGAPDAAGAEKKGYATGTQEKENSLDIAISVIRADLIKDLKDVERELKPVLCMRGS